MNIQSAANAVTEEHLLMEVADDDYWRPAFIEILPFSKDTDGSCSAEGVNENCYDEKQENLAVVKEEPCDDYESSAMCSIKSEVPSDVDKTQSRVHAALKTFVSARLQKKYNSAINTGGRSVVVKTEPASNHVTERPNDKPSTGEAKIEADSIHTIIPTEKYKCTECGKCCESGYKLARHRRCHSGERPFQCTICGKQFAESHHLVEHSRIHSGEKPYKCYMCEKVFRFYQNLHRHMRVHTGQKPFKCSLCDRSFTLSKDLQRHKSCVHSNSRPYECDLCGNLFKTNDRLKFHVRRTHLLLCDKLTWFTCDICQKKFSRVDRVKQHLLRHEGVKPYICSECPMRFCQACDLKRHQLVHLDLKPFCCSLCGKYFKSQTYVTSHIKRCIVKRQPRV